MRSEIGLDNIALLSSGNFKITEAHIDRYNTTKNEYQSKRMYEKVVLKYKMNSYIAR